MLSPVFLILEGVWFQKKDGRWSTKLAELTVCAISNFASIHSVGHMGSFLHLQKLTRLGIIDIIGNEKLMFMEKCLVR